MCQGKTDGYAHVNEWKAINVGLMSDAQRLPILLACGLAAPASLHAQSPTHTHIHAAGKVEEEQSPLTVDVVYTADIWRNASGGARQGTRYLDNIDIVAEADMERLIGWDGASIHVYGLYNNGKSLTELIGDAQAPSNIETGVKAARLYEAWINQKIGQSASIKVGLYDLNSEFDSLDVGSLFMASAHGIGTDISQTGLNGPSIFPVTSLAARVAVGPATGWVVRAAVLDAVPGDIARPKQTAVILNKADGALLIGELEAPLPNGKLLFGHWRYTGEFDALDGTRRRGNNGIYLRGETQIIKESGAQDQGLSGFFRLGTADGRINTFSHFITGGLNYTGAIKGRDEDQLGLGIAAAFTSKSYRLLNASENAEIAVELTYRGAVTNWLSLQPNVQYIINPSADRTLRNALALGLRAELSYRF
jgi:porin